MKVQARSQKFLSYLGPVIIMNMFKLQEIIIMLFKIVEMFLLQQTPLACIRNGVFQLYESASCTEIKAESFCFSSCVGVFLGDTAN
jgi:hypothetical protein